MVQFSVPEKAGHSSQKKSFFNFSVSDNPVLFAGSRHLQVPQGLCTDLIKAFGRLDKGFTVGCAKGVDQSFRYALSNSSYSKQTFVACAFKGRIKRSYGLFASLVVPEGMPPKGALVRRTLWLCKHCSMAVLFADDPLSNCWSKGSKLVFKSCLIQLIPLFVVTNNPPLETSFYKVLESSLFGVVSGFWAVPHPIIDGGLCDDT